MGHMSSPDRGESFLATASREVSDVPADQSHSPCIYDIDLNGRIVWVNEAWNRFAAENAAEHLKEESVLGSRLWDFISDPETQQIYHLLHEKVLEEQRSLSFPFRCDGPALRRYLRMEMASPRQQVCRFHSVVVKLEARSEVRLWKPTVKRSDSFLRACSWCKKVDVGQESWQEVEDALCELELFNRSSLPQLTHTICPSCYTSMQSVLQSESKKG
jgi:hypothetical protein